MNVVYAALDALRPTARQIRELSAEAVTLASQGDKQAALFAYQLREHVRRRVEGGADR
jgi:hypothetical protein